MLTFDVLPVVTAGKAVMQGPVIHGSKEITPAVVKVFYIARFHASWLYINKIQRGATVCTCLLLQNYATCFGCLSHPSSGVHQTVTAASGTGHSVRATTFRQRGL